MQEKIDIGKAKVKWGKKFKIYIEIIFCSFVRFVFVFRNITTLNILYKIIIQYSKVELTSLDG